MNKFWLDISDRERTLIVICGVMIVLFIIYLFVVAPLSREKSAAQRAFVAQQETYERVLALAATTSQKRADVSAGMSPRQPIREVATTVAHEQGIAISRIQPTADDRITLWIDQATTQEITRWLLTLENDHNWTATKVSINKNTDGSSVRGQFEFAGVSQ